MINREIVYERNLTGSFMKIAAGIHAGLDEKLMLRRKLPGLLAVEKAYMDGEGQYWYNISGKQSLDMYCRVKEVDISFIEKLIMSICSEMEILEYMSTVETRVVSISSRFPLGVVRTFRHFLELSAAAPRACIEAWLDHLGGCGDSSGGLKSQA